MGRAIELASVEDEPAVAEAVEPEGSTEVAEETLGEERDAAPVLSVGEITLSGVSNANDLIERMRDMARSPVAERVDVEQAADLTAALKERTRATRNEANESYLRLLKEYGLK